MADWETYAKVHAKRKPREQVVRAVTFCTEKMSALDLGAGTLIESAYLLEVGFEQVSAVDSSPQSIEFATQLDSPKFSLINKGFHDFTFQQDTYDLINAQYALPFYGPKGFSAFIQLIVLSLK
jgi:SAM-dependent methyltransferase